jgi:signal-transduction protein with cAMP-binding, CBS, and nucleotidyltransferase domain
MVANLIRTSEVLLAVPPDERQALVERFETRVFEKGDKLIAEKQDSSGLHIIASGEVAVVGHEENNESFVISTLGVGEVVGEVALVLRRKANADVVAVMPTVSLHLPREDFMTLVRLHPSILASLYLRAVERDEETKSILTMSTTTMADADEYVLI